MGSEYLFHFPREFSIFNDKYSGNGAAARMISMIKSRSIEGNNQKGFFYRKQVMPRSVSFTERDISDLTPFTEKRSHYGLVFLRSNPKLEQARQVQYMTRPQMAQRVRQRPFTEQEKPFIDLDRNVQGHEYQGVDGEIYWNARYNFTWEMEYRLLCGEFKFEKEDMPFITVRTTDDVLAINDKLGLEAMNLKSFQQKAENFNQASRTKTGQTYRYETLFEQVRNNHKKENTFTMVETVEDFFEQAYSWLEKKVLQETEPVQA